MTYFIAFFLKYKRNDYLFSITKLFLFMKCVGDSLTLSDDTLEFIANKPLMNDVVETQPLFVKEQEDLMQLELHWNTTELVFYVASSRYTCNNKRLYVL